MLQRPLGADVRTLKMSGKAQRLLNRREEEHRQLEEAEEEEEGGGSSTRRSSEGDTERSGGEDGDGEDILDLDTISKSQSHEDSVARYFQGKSARTRDGG